MEDRKRDREDEWFARNERDLIDSVRKAREAREKERAAHEKAEERRRLKELHFMKCPKCGHDMKAEQIADVEVDRCTHCEGVYFDAGELEQTFLKKQDERRSLFRRLVGL